MMRRRLFALFMAGIVLFPLLAACSTQSDPDAVGDIRLYQVLPVARGSRYAGGEGEGEAIALINVGAKPHSIRRWAVQTTSGKVVLPQLKLQPGQVIYLANNAEYFRMHWNFAPHFEYGRDADKAVPDLRVQDSKIPVLNDQGDIVRLLDEQGKVADILVFGNIENPPSRWIGKPVQLVESYPVTPANQVITRLRDHRGYRLEARAESWSGGTSDTPGRVYFAGQTDLPVRTANGTMTLTAAAAPDNATSVLLDQVDRSRRSIRIVGYRFTNLQLAERLAAAVRRGVWVQVVVDRNPGGGDLPSQDKLVHEKLDRGGVDVRYFHDWDGDLSSRYHHVQSSYALFDDEAVLITSGDWTDNSFPRTELCGNRDWTLVIDGNRDVVDLFKEVWDADTSAHSDIRVYDPKLDRPLGPGRVEADPCVGYTAVKSLPLRVTTEAAVTRILAPDNMLDREQGFLGILRGAERELLISARSIDAWWGPVPNSAPVPRQPYLEEVVEAARRGVRVQVLLDRRGVRRGNLRDNQYVVEYLNELAARENLDLEARLVNMDRAGIGRDYSNSSLIVDDSFVLSGISGVENAFRYARNVAVKVDGVLELTEYFRDLFVYDWNASQRPNKPWNVVAVPRDEGTLIDWSSNVELDVVRYQVYYKPYWQAPWRLVREVETSGCIDQHQSGIWGVVAISKSGQRSDYAEVSR